MRMFGYMGCWAAAMASSAIASDRGASGPEATGAAAAQESRSKAADGSMSSPEDAAARTPIIVEGRRDDPPLRAQTGSRIPSQPLFKDLSVSTSTGVAGLTPGSGMTPDGDRVRKRTTRSCSSSSKDVGKQASCLLLQAQAARLQNEIPEATDIYRFLVSSEQFNPAERLAGGTELHNLAKSTGNETLREEALIRLLDSKVLDEVQQASARRTLVDLALQRGDKPLAVERLEQHVADENADAQSVANLAILRRESGASGATALMRRAIDSITAIGGDVPQGWLDFVAANAPE